MSATETIRLTRETTSPSGPKLGPSRQILDMVVAGFVRLERRVEKRRSRRMLLELSDHQLKDIGVTRADAYREGIRSFFD